jgi:hypothetical protein
MANFDYILHKIRDAKFEKTPFKHIYIESIFSDEDFKEITASPEVNVPPVSNDEELIAELHTRNFKEIEFPGTTTDIPSYLAWHKDREGVKNLNQATCEGYGVTLRLQRTTDPASTLTQAYRFFRSDSFWETLISKFGISDGDVRRDVGVQKYLDGYEISPHPDIRAKALTFMININPSPDAETIDYNTHYMTFTPERAYIGQFWSSDSTADRCWVPWDWCVSEKRQTKNNSIVVFSPANDTLHAVKAAYDHLITQRTQFYGNLWYNKSWVKRMPTFRDLDRMKQPVTT